MFRSCQLSRPAAFFAVIAVGIGMSGCGEKANIPFNRTTSADHQHLIHDNGSPIKVCVGKVDVTWNTNNTNGQLPPGMVTHWTYMDLMGYRTPVATSYSSSNIAQSNKDGRIWSDAIRKSIAGMLQQRSRELGRKIVFVDRDRLEQRLDERDLVIADVVQGDDLLARGKELGIDLWIFGTLQIQVDTVTDYKTPTSNRILSNVWGARRFVDRSPKAYITRSIIMTGALRAVDNVTGRDHFTHTIEGERVQVEKPVLISEASMADLTPENKEIRDVIDAEVTEFVGRFIPINIAKIVQFESSGNENSIKGLRLLVGKQYPEARAAAEKAVAEKTDDHKSYFIAGYASEMMGDIPQAIRYYELAIGYGGEDVDDPEEYEHQYRQAYDRVRKQRRDGYSYVSWR